MHSRKQSAQLLFSAFQKAGIEDIILSPGSRNAPLIIEALARNFNPQVILDERAAGFIALGMAQQSGYPAVVISTSGTAVLNYHPAVAEAFYSKIPLIVVSADRPLYRIDKGEGQTIRQEGVLKNHTLFSATLPLDGIGKETGNLIQQAIETAILKQGPVHLNLPFEEPLYETTQKAWEFPHPPTLSKDISPILETQLEQAEKIWKKAQKKLIIVSQNTSNEILSRQLERIAAFNDTVILTENTANVHGKDLLSHIDRLIFPMKAEEWENYAPELIITIGRNIISKKIKYLLRAVKPAYGHWHIGIENFPPDTFDTLNAYWETSPEMFLSQLLFRLYDYMPESDYKEIWQRMASYRQQKHDIFMKRIPAGDMMIYKILAKILSDAHNIQWGNSTVVRYAQLFPFVDSIRHFSNRGTSGIDGSISTAIGAAHNTALPVLAVTGDLAFQYDNHALWNKLPENFKLIIINNGGGDIFRFIPGPSGIRDYEKYFVYSHQTDFQHLARHYGISYHQYRVQPNSPIRELEKTLKTFIFENTHQVLEINTTEVPNAEILKEYFAFLS